MPAPQAARMTANTLNHERTTLARDAQDIADRAARIAADLDGGIECGDHTRLAQDVQQFLIRASRYTATRETASLYDAELAMQTISEGD